MLSLQDRNLSVNLYSSLISSAYELGQEEKSFEMAEQLFKPLSRFRSIIFRPDEAFLSERQNIRSTHHAAVAEKTVLLFLSKEGLSMIRFFSGAV
jgi:hypothetical protein